MKEINQSKIVERYIKEIRQRRKNSNCQFMIPQLERLVQLEKVFAYELEDAFLIVENKGLIYNLYYMSDSWDWLQYARIIKKYYSKIVISIVGKQLYEIETNFSKNKYSVYKTYQRLRCKEKNIVFSDVEYCSIEDKEVIKEMMDNTFDMFSDHIPSDEELVAFLANRQIICVRQNDLPVGFIIFEDKGKTSYIRMVCVDERHQGKGIASELMTMYFYIHKEYTSFTLWYDMKNERARSLYEKWDYQEEQLYNLIYVI